MPKFFLVLFCLIPASLWSQRVTISAKVVDKDTKEPLSFASVGLKDKPIGTVTNLQGDFDFHFPASNQNDILVISILGYSTYQVPVNELIGRPNLTIELPKSITVLEEVVILDSLTGGDILAAAISRIADNAPAEPYLLDAFYRDLKKVGGSYVSILEAATKIYDEDYKTPRNKFKLRERVALMEVRRSLGYGNKFTSYFDEDNLLEDLLLHNNVRYRQFPEEEIFFASLKREPNSTYNGHEIFVVSHRADYLLKVYIDKTNFGIIHLEYENNQNEEVTRRKGMSSRFVSIKKVIDFKPYQGKLFLNYISVDSQINWYDGRSGELRFETELHQQLLINSIQSSPSQRIGTTEKMKSYGLQYQDMPYNKSFWDTYNVIKESPLDKKIIEDLEKSGPLETQFQNK